MSKRESFSAFEDIIIKLYNRKALDKELLCVMWQGMSMHLEMDAGGYGYIKSLDHKLLPQIIVETLKLENRAAIYVPEANYDQEELAEIDDRKEYFATVCGFYFWERLYYTQDWSTI